MNRDNSIASLIAPARSLNIASPSPVEQEPCMTAKVFDLLSATDFSTLSDCTGYGQFALNGPAKFVLSHRPLARASPHSRPYLPELILGQMEQLDRFRSQDTIHWRGSMEGYVNLDFLLSGTSLLHQLFLVDQVAERTSESSVSSVEQFPDNVSPTS